MYYKIIVLLSQITIFCIKYTTIRLFEYSTYYYYYYYYYYYILLLLLLLLFGVQFTDS